MDDMKAARPSKRARLTVEEGTLVLELPDIIHYIYTFSHMSFVMIIARSIYFDSIGKGKNVPDFSSPSGCEE